MIRLNPVFIFALIVLLQSCMQQLCAQSFPYIQLECKPEATLPVQGSGMGENFNFIRDLDGNGTIEFLISSTAYASNTDREYSDLINVYEFQDDAPYLNLVDQTDLFYDNGVSSAVPFDRENDGLIEILMGFEDGRVAIYQFINQELQEIQSTSISSTVVDVLYGDANNDGSPELVVSSNSMVTLLDPFTMDLIQAEEIEIREIFRLAQTDLDPAMELITNYAVYELSPTGITTEWEDPPFSFGIFYSADIDGDGLDEIIHLAPNSRVKFYNVETQELLKELIVSSETAAFHDCNGDGILDVILEDISAYDILHDSIIWTIPFSPFYPNAYTVADPNADGVFELYTFPQDLVFALEIPTGSILWSIEPSIHSGLHANSIFTIGNIDTSDSEEIILLRQRRSLLTADPFVTDQYFEVAVFDALTKQHQWSLSQYHEDGQLGKIWDPRDIIIADITGDSLPEILIAASIQNKPSLLVIDPVTRQLVHTYIHHNGRVAHRIAVADVDLDGELEIILTLFDDTSSTWVTVVVLNAATFVIEWESEDYYAGPSALEDLHVVNINDDPYPEIITANNRLYIFYPADWSFWISAETNIHAFDIGDIDNDENLEIVYSTFFKNKAQLVQLDGNTLQVTPVGLTGTTTSYSTILIDDLNQNMIPEIYLCNQADFFVFEQPDRVFRSPILGYDFNEEDNFFVTNYGDTTRSPVILTSSSNALLELYQDCFDCIDLHIDLSKTDLICGSTLPDGSIQAVPAGGTQPYTFQWNTGDTTELLENLSDGTYSVTLTDANGCTDTASTTLIRPRLRIQKSVINHDCNSLASGRARVIIQEGLPPYQFLWSNGIQNDTAIGLSAGWHYVTVTDAAGCIVTDSVILQSLELSVQVFQDAPDCNSMSIGRAHAEVVTGSGPYTYTWSNGQTGRFAFDLAPGQYSVSVTTTQGCLSIDSVTIEARELHYELDIDSACLGASIGAIHVQILTGSPPYYVNNIEVLNSATIDSLYFGSYQVSIRDEYCEFFETIQMPITEFDAAIEILQVDSIAQLYNVSIVPEGGVQPYVFAWNDPQGQDSSTATNLSPGTYQVTISDSRGCFTVFEVIIEGTVSNDDISRTIDVHVSPNPALDHVWIYTAHTVVLDILDINGTSCVQPLEVLASDAPTNVDVSNLIPGVYWLRFQSATETSAKVMVKL